MCIIIIDTKNGKGLPESPCLMYMLAQQPICVSSTSGEGLAICIIITVQALHRHARTFHILVHK